MYINYSLYILFLPLAAFLIQIFFGKKLPRQGDWVSIGAISITLVLAVTMFISMTTWQLLRIPEIGLPGVVIAITDEGDGIPAEHLPRLTERFYRVDKGRSRTMGGTGLGLAIVKHIVNRHRGRLTVDSALGQGTVFKVFLPSVRETAESDDLSQY